MLQQKKRGEDIIYNVRKETHVMDEAESVEDVENLDFGSIRKIASRMNKRIQSTFSDKQNIFNSVIAEIEQPPVSS